jgi:hypothetical protein
VPSNGASRVPSLVFGKPRVIAEKRRALERDRTPAPVRRIKLRAGRATKIADDSFRYAMLTCSLSVMAIVALILHELITRSQLSIA